MPRFISLNYQQSTMVVINYFDQLQAGTFEHAIRHLIDSTLDLSVFYPKYKNDKNGRPAYDPVALLKIILFAYSKGITSSREIQWCCEYCGCHGIWRGSRAPYLKANIRRHSRQV
jgi:hypothetical protein